MRHSPARAAEAAPAATSDRARPGTGRPRGPRPRPIITTPSASPSAPSRACVAARSRAAMRESQQRPSRGLRRAMVPESDGPSRHEVPSALASQARGAAQHCDAQRPAVQRGSRHIARLQPAASGPIESSAPGGRALLARAARRRLSKTANPEDATSPRPHALWLTAWVGGAGAAAVVRSPPRVHTARRGHAPSDAGAA